MLTIVISVLLLFSGALAFDRSPGNFKEFGQTNGEDYYGRHRPMSYVDVSTSFTKVTILGTAEAYYPDYDARGNLVARKATGVFGQEGSGWYLGNGYWVTNYHVITPEQVVIQVSKNITFVTSPIKIVQMTITIGQNTILGSVPATIVWSDQEQDLALLKVEGNWPAFKDPGYRMVGTGSYGSDLLYPGMSIATIVAIRQDPDNGDISKTPWFEVRYGHIVDTKPRLPGDLPPELLPWFSLNDVTTDIVIYPGDSGSPVFGFINGIPVYIGAFRAAAGYVDEQGIVHYYSYFTRTDFLIRFALEAK